MRVDTEPAGWELGWSPRPAPDAPAEMAAGRAGGGPSHPPVPDTLRHRWHEVATGVGGRP